MGAGKMNTETKKIPTALIIYLIVAVLLSVMLCTALLNYLFTGCLWWDCAPSRNFSVYDLSLPGSLFPEGVGPLILRPDRGTINAPEEASGTLIWDDGSAIYIVKRFFAFDQAADWYMERSQQQNFTSPLIDLAPYESILNFRSEYADQFSIDCGYFIDQISSKYFAQYQEYFIYFNGYFGDEGLTPEDYLQIIQYIDDTLHEKIGN